jgi:hypothetical protein
MRDTWQSDGMNHWYDCWREHHACAIRRIERLQARLDRMGGDNLPPTPIGEIAARTIREIKQRHGRA